MNLYIRAAIIFSVFFAVFSFAAVEPWSIVLLQCVIYCSFLFYAFSGRALKLTALSKLLSAFFLVIFVFCAIQCLCEKTVFDTAAARPFTLSRLYTLNALSLMLFYYSVLLLVPQVFNGYKKIKALSLSIMVCGTVVVIAANVLPGGDFVSFFRKTSLTYSSFGPFINRNHAGIFLCMSFFCGLSYFMPLWADPKSSYGSGEKSPARVRLLGLAALGIIVFGIVNTLSRGAMLSFAATLTMYGVIMVLFFVKNKAKKISYLLAIAAIAAGVYGAVYVNVEDINKFTHRSSGASEHTRKILYKGAANMLSEYRSFGVGLDAFSAGFPAYYTEKLKNVDRVHNDWLEFVLGTGIFGAAVLLFTLAGCIYVIAGRLRRIEDPAKKITFLTLSAALFSMCLGSFVDFHFHVPADAFVFFIISGMLSSETFGWRTVGIRTRAVWAVFAFFMLAGIVFYARYSAAWYNFFMGSSMTYDKKAAFYEKGISFYGSQTNAEKLAIAYYNAYTSEKDESRKTEYLKKLDAHASFYLRRYPLSSNLLRLKSFASSVLLK